MGVGIYSAVLLTTSTIPGWAHQVMIPAVYATTAIMTGMAAVVLIQAVRRQVDADVLSIAHANLWLVGWWLVALLVFLLTLVGGPSARIFLTGVPLFTLVAAVVLAGIAPFVVAFFRPSGPAVRLALSSVLVLVGGFLVRYAIVMAPQSH